MTLEEDDDGPIVLDLVDLIDNFLVKAFLGS